MMKNDDITFSPSLIYWFIRNIPVIILFIAFIVTAKILSHFEYVSISLCVLALICLLIIFRNFLKILTTKWVVTSEQIKIYEGIINKSINYIELYRVYDYEVKQNIVQAAVGLKNVYIHSGDKSTPELKMYGILSKDIDIISLIRNRVEKQKRIKGIYEFTNR